MDSDVVMNSVSSSSSSSVPAPSDAAALPAVVQSMDFTLIHSAFPIHDRAKLQYQSLDLKEKSKSKDAPPPIDDTPIRYIPLSFQFDRDWNGGGSSGTFVPQRLVLQVLKAELTGLELGTKHRKFTQEQTRPVFCIYEYWLNPAIARDTQQADYQHEVTVNAGRSNKHSLAFGLRWYESTEIAYEFTKRFQSLTGVMPSQSLFASSPALIAASIGEGRFRPLWSESYVTNGKELTEAGQIISVVRPSVATRKIVRTASAAPSSMTDVAPASWSLPLPAFPLPFQGTEDNDSESARTPILLSELAMCAMSGIIREKPDWHNKILNPVIRLRWKLEAQSQYPRLSTKALLYTMQELDYLAEMKRKALAAPPHVSYDPAPIDGVWQSEEAVDAELIRAILQEIKVLEDVPEAENDYHPDSEKQVIDLVHPSLFCVRYGRTLHTEKPFQLQYCLTQASNMLPWHQPVLSPKVGAAGVQPKPIVPPIRRPAKSSSKGYTLSDAYCWLPADFLISNNGKVIIKSYINNLHPQKHAKLYRLLKQAFERVLPMLERVLTFISFGQGMNHGESYRMKGGYFYEKDPILDSIEERIAIAAAKQQEMHAIVTAASKDSQLSENSHASSTTASNGKEQAEDSETVPPSIAYLTTFCPSPVSALQRANTLHLLQQVHEGLTIDPKALTWVTTFQDYLAHMIIQECCNSKAPKNAAELDVERARRQKLRDEYRAKCEEQQQAEKEIQQKAIAAATVAAAASPSSIVGMEDVSHAPSAVALPSSAAASVVQKPASSHRPPVDWTFLEGMEPFFHPSIDSEMNNLAKYAYDTSRKFVTNYLKTGTAGLIFRNALARRWYEDFKTNQPAGAASVKPALTHVQQLSLCAMVEFMTAELLELSGNCTRDSMEEMVTVPHVKMACDGDNELKALVDGIFSAFNVRNVRDIIQQAKATATMATVSVANQEQTHEGVVLEPSSGGDLIAKPTKEQLAELKSKETAELQEAIKAEDAADEVARRQIVGDNATEEAHPKKKHKSSDIRPTAALEDDEDDGQWRRSLRFGDVVFPYPRPTPFDALPATSKVSLRGRRLQVIVKLANIVLTPANPVYKGGSWHVEGMENENIVASLIVYLHSENISTSRLSFRHSCRFMRPEQDENDGPAKAWGLRQDGELNQMLGAVTTKAGRAIAFPNVYQHRVDPFELLDKSKVGVRKILVFFLVDPNMVIPSSWTIPPQNVKWVEEYFTEQVQPIILEETPLVPDLLNIIREYVIGPKEFNPNPHLIDLAGAKLDREQLMKERKYFVERNSQAIFQREYAFCEH